MATQPPLPPKGPATPQPNPNQPASAAPPSPDVKVSPGGPAAPRPAPPGGAPPPPPPTAGQQAPGQDLPSDEDLTHPHLTFFQQPWVQNVLPFVTSLTVHAAILIIGILVLKTLPTLMNAQPLEEQVIVPEAAMSDGVPGGVENPGIGGDPTRAAAQDEFTENTHPDGWSDKPGDSSIAESIGGGEGDSASSAIIGAGGGGGFGKGRRGIGGGAGEGFGAGTGSGGGRLAPFGTPGGGIPGPKGKVFGSGGNARTIAFVCDASGSMIAKMTSLKAELQKAIEGLRPVQSFSVIFFQDEKYNAYQNGALIPATPGNKRKVYEWLDEVVTTGTTNPIPGLEIAFRTKAQLIYILTDGDFPDNQAVLKKVQDLNTPKVSRVNTIAFVSEGEDDTSESFKQLLQQIAEDNGGNFNHVSEEELD